MPGLKGRIKCIILSFIMMKKAVLFAVMAILPLAGGSAGAAEEAFQSADVCRRCHTDIFKNWEKSLHALAFQNPIFQTAYQKAYTETRGEAKKYCLGCHAPTVKVTGDYDARDEVTREGITCDFCHTVTEVHLENDDNPFVNAPGKVKRSILEEAESPYHETAFSEDFASSKLCAGCHDFRNRNGVHVGITYSEWKGSPYAETGKQCQSCHMPTVEGKTVKKGGRNGISDHSLSHNVDSMKNAVTVETGRLKPVGKKLEAEVSITNAGAGHYIPTGTPARQLVLEVRSLDSDGNAIETLVKVYRKKIVDADGKEIQEDGDVFLYGKKIVEDNRLKPGETRNEKFSFSRGVDIIKKVEAEVYFLYMPTIKKEVEMRIPVSGVSSISR